MINFLRLLPIIKPIIDFIFGYLKKRSEKKLNKVISVPNLDKEVSLKYIFNYVGLNTKFKSDIDFINEFLSSCGKYNLCTSHDELWKMFIKFKTNIPKRGCLIFWYADNIINMDIVAIMLNDSQYICFQDGSIIIRSIKDSKKIIAGYINLFNI